MPYYYLLLLLQVAYVVDLDDLNEMDKELTKAVTQNTRRYTNIVSDVVYEMLPDYKHREVILDHFLILTDVSTYFVASSGC